MKQPMQPLYIDSDGVVRFQQNEIVRHLLDCGDYDLNNLARLPFSDEDRRQFAQLIGYSVGGYCDLSYVDEAAADAVVRVGESAVLGE
jgi:hypothetical protein